MAKDQNLIKLEADLRFEKKKIKGLSNKIQALSKLVKTGDQNWLQDQLHEANKRASALQIKIAAYNPS